MANPQQYSSSSAHTMIGSTTTFYDPAIQQQQPEPELDYNAYLQHFHQQPDSYQDYAPLFPPYPSQTFSQPPQYLPTPSVSPTSASGRQMASVPHQSSQYYTLQGAVDHHPGVGHTVGAAFDFGGMATGGGTGMTASVGAGPGAGVNPAKRDAAAVRRKSSQPKPSQKPTGGPRKRPRKSQDGVTHVSPSQDAEDSDEDDAEDGDGPKPLQRLPGACRYCKKLKMRCEFPSSDSTTCRRCKAGGHQCVVEGRKPRSGPNKREFLLAQLRQKEAIIDSLLKQIHNPAHQTPLNLALPAHAASAAAPDSAAANKDVLAWIEKIEGASVRTAGGQGGANAFRLDGRADPEDDGDAFDDDGDEDDGAAGDNEAEQEAEADPEQGGEKEKKSKLHSLPEEAAPLGLIANLSLRNTSTVRKPSVPPLSELDTSSPAAAGGGGAEVNASPEQAGENDNDVGVANATYFLPGPATNLDLRRVIVERTMPPEILVHGLVTPDDVEKLFEIFYERINPFLSLLDPVIHTPARTFGRCPFLFTVVCAVASRYYAPKADIYKYAMHFAKTAAATSLIDGWKSVELCQAYLLMSVYSVPARRWEEDRSWLYLGLAIRIATDLNLHQPSSTKTTSEKHEREVLNRTRTWMICFNLDRSTSTQLGKPSTIKEDFIIRNSRDWYRRSPYNHPYDVHLCAYTQLLRLVTRFHEEVYSDQSVAGGLNKVDFYTVTMRYDDKLRAFQAEASAMFEKDSSKDDPGSVFRTQLLPFIVNYSRLVMFSFGFQQAVQKGLRREDVFFQRCFEAACAVISVMVDRLAPTGYLRFAPDAHFVFASFASAFLLKLLRPDFAGIVGPSHEKHILALVGRYIKMLGSSDISVDDKHTPKLYSRFLSGLVARHRQIQSQRQVQSQQQQNQAYDILPKVETSPVEMGSQMTALSNGSSHNQGTAQLQSQSLPDVTQVQPIQNAEFLPSIALPEARLDEFYAPSDATIGQFNMEGLDGLQMPGEDLLASMQAINNPVWWEHVMMPGFTWPESTMSPSQATSLSPGDQAQQSPMDPYAFVQQDPGAMRSNSG